MSVTKSLSNTLFRILPLMDSSQATSTATATAGNVNGGNNGVGSSAANQDDKDNDDATTLSSDSCCSSCVSSCPSFVNERELLGPYRLVKTLGIGEFGKIKLGIHTETEQKVAIKVIKKNSDAANLIKVEREIQVLKSLRHPHIVKVIEVIETDTRIGIILEYASGGELFEFVLSHNSLEEDIARNLFAQLISSVNHMHMKGIVHRDLKLENLLFLDDERTHIIVSDFGFANGGANNTDLLSTRCGSPTYAAPELVYPSGGYKGPAADVWSCGVILYCMVCGYLPFDDDPENPESANLHQLYQYIRSIGTPSFPRFVSHDAQDLIRKMLQHDPTKRCSVNDIINHPWLQAYRSTLFNMSAEQLEQQALDSIKKHHIASPAVSTGASQQHRYHANSHHHRHQNQLWAIQETQQHQEEEGGNDDDEQQINDESPVQPYKFLELNHHADIDDDKSDEEVDQIQTQLLQNANHQQTQIISDSVLAQSTQVIEQPRDVMETVAENKPVETTPVSTATGQEHQNTTPVQNVEQPNIIPTNHELDQVAHAQIEIGNEDTTSEPLASKANHEHASGLAQMGASLGNNESRSMITSHTKQRELDPSNDKHEVSEQHGNGPEALCQATNNVEVLPQTENLSEGLSLTDGQQCGSTDQKDQGQQEELALDNHIPQDESQEDQPQEVYHRNTHDTAGLASLSPTTSHESAQPHNVDEKLDGKNTHINNTTGLIPTPEISKESIQTDNVDQKLDEPTTEINNENADAPNSEELTTDQHETEHQNDASGEKEILTVQNYSEQPPQHPMDIAAPSVSPPTNNGTNTIAVPESSPHTDDKTILSLPALSLTPNGELDLLHNSGTTEQQRERRRSIRRQKKFRPSVTEDEPLPSNTMISAIIDHNTANSTINNHNTAKSANKAPNNITDNTGDVRATPSAVNSANTITIAKTKNEADTIDQTKSDKDSEEYTGIRPQLLGKGDSTRYYSATTYDNVITTDEINNNHVSDSDDGGDHNDSNKGNSRSKVQHWKSTSLPLLNHSTDDMDRAIDANTSTTNLNDAIKKYNNGASLPTSPRKNNKRFSSILSLNHVTGPRPQRSQSTHLPKKSDFKNQDKGSSSPTTTTSGTKLPPARKRTVTQTVRAWIHNKKKPFSKHHHHDHHHRPSTSSLSESASSGEFDGHEHSLVGAQQPQELADTSDEQQRRALKQQQIRQYRAPSSPSSSVETPTVDQHSGMRTLPHAQGENLTSMAPGHLILALVRMLTALGIDVKHDSSYQLTCLRKSCHHQKHSFSKKRNSKPFTVLTAPIYGPPELDHGHHVAFSVEICRSLLSDLHVIDIQLTEGDDLAFQFLRSKLLALLNLNA